MAKDPAFLFYTSDFLTGTMTMTNEQVGMYIRLMCLQHQKGKLTEKDMLNICGTHDEDVFAKFSRDASGCYQNQRLAEEIEKRKKYSESRRNNRKKNISKTYDSDMNNICKSYDQHMENENVIVNREDSKEEKGGVGEKEGKEGELLIVPRMLTVWKTQNPAYYIDPDADMAALGAISRHIAKASDTKYQPQEETAKKAILGAWGTLVEFISTHTHFRQYSLQQVAKHFQSIHQSMNHEHHPKPTTRATQSAGRDKRGISERRNKVARNW